MYTNKLSLGKSISLPLFILLLTSCQTPDSNYFDGEIESKPVTVSGTILSLEQSPFAPFRYHGEMRIIEPPKYRDAECHLFILDFQRDHPASVGKIIKTQIDSFELKLGLEPIPFYPGTTPSLGFVYENGSYHPIDSDEFDSPMEASGKIVDYRPSGDGEVYFVYDMMLQGDIVEIEISEPKKYRGAKIQFLIENPDSVSPLWKRSGTSISFKVSESVIAWEPWGFTPFSDLLSFEIGD